MRLEEANVMEKHHICVAFMSHDGRNQQGAPHRFCSQTLLSFHNA